MEENLRIYTTLGVLKQMGHPDFAYYEWRHLKFARETLVNHWPLVQGGVDSVAERKWREIIQFLELDEKATRDLMLLAHQGEAGRAEANEILWVLLSDTALDPDDRDMSNRTSALVGRARRHNDRPPERHEDRTWWTWSHYWVPRNPAFAPRAVPRDAFRIFTNNGRPLAPPHCWSP